MKVLNRLFLIAIFMFASVASAAEMQLKSGNFKDANSAHQSEGAAILVQDGDKLSIKFINHFYVTPGPDLYVWLVKNPNPKNSGDVKASQTYQLAKLKTPSGKQSYNIPSDINMADYGSVAIWCREFGVLFAHATLK